MASEKCPVLRDLDALEKQDLTRTNSLVRSFTKVYGRHPTVIGRSPGRVNLIGEHIDYSGYAVLPMALGQSTMVAIRLGGDKLVISNANDKKYKQVVLAANPDQPVDTESNSWANYFLAAYKGVYEFLEAKSMAPSSHTGMEVLVDGNVPTGAGVSSSAALTCSTALAILGALGQADCATKGEVAEFVARCERYVGTQAGGMDQAISIMGKPNVAQLIEFNPVRGSDVLLPAGATFIVANSRTVSNKAQTADTNYNRRVVECTAAAMLLAQALGMDLAGVKTLQDVEPVLAEHYASLEAGVTDILQEGAYTTDKIAEVLGCSVADLPNALGFADNRKKCAVLDRMARDQAGLELRRRARHVFSEAARVHDFRRVANGNGSDDEKLQQLGALMDASQVSCRDDYGCSCPELDELVALQKGAGALGSRLTGAGWGGCTVSLVREADAEAFLQAIKEQYFKKKFGTVSADDIFASKPAQGGCILQLDEAQLKAMAAAAPSSKCNIS